jgi:uncharacterized membrane protein YgcG
MNGPSMRFGRVAVFAATLLTAVTLPAAARDFVQDQAAMFSPATVAQLNSRISSFSAQTGKEIVVLTTPSLGGATLQDAAATAFSQQNVNGVLIFIARDDRRDIIVPDRAGAQAGWFTPDVLRSIRTSMESQFKSESYDAGVTGAVDAILNIYRAHLGSLRQGGASGAALPAQQSAQPGGIHISMFWWIIIAIVGFLILRSILRAMSAPRYYGGAPGVPPGAAPPGGPGYGPGYGYGGIGGGGSFWSGLLGGLGGAWLGNELFRGGGGGFAPTQAGQLPPDSGGSWGGGDPGGGWQSDAGQADLGGASGGDWSGGGFGGDMGGGDFGGGGGDSGGGW